MYDFSRPLLAVHNLWAACIASDNAQEQKFRSQPQAWETTVGPFEPFATLEHASGVSPSAKIGRAHV